MSKKKWIWVLMMAAGFISYACDDSIWVVRPQKVTGVESVMVEDSGTTTGTTITMGAGITLSPKVLGCNAGVPAAPAGGAACSNYTGAWTMKGAGLSANQMVLRYDGTLSVYFPSWSENLRDLDRARKWVYSVKGFGEIVLLDASNKVVGSYLCDYATMEMWRFDLDTELVVGNKIFPDAGDGFFH